MIWDSNVLRPDEKYVADISEAFPARRLFHVNRTPDGFAPQEIRDAWVDLSLPVRTIDTGDETLVLGVDALLALKRAERREAFDWWTHFYETDDTVHMNLGVGLPLFLNPWATRRSLVARISFLNFDRSDGTLIKVKKGSPK